MKLNRCRFFVSFLFITFMSSCTKKPPSYYANNNEKEVINRMVCWENMDAEMILNRLVSEKMDDDQKSELWDEYFEINSKTYKLANEKLLNDTVLINLIRDSVKISSLLALRKTLIQQLKQAGNEASYFQDIIEELEKEVVEYNVFKTTHNVLNSKPGILYFSIRYDSPHPKRFFRNYSQILKERLKQKVDVGIIPGTIKKLDRTLKNIEKIDRKLWLCMCYQETQKRIFEEEIQTNRAIKIDSLFK